MERLASYQGRGEQVRPPSIGLCIAAPAAPGHPDHALPSPSLQDLHADSRVDFDARIWICPFCFQRNHFPPHYSEMSDTNLPAELYPNYTTIQYVNTSPPSHQSQFGHAAAALSGTPPSVFLFVLDTCMIEEELVFAKSALKQAIGLVPDNALVGFISYGTQVQVHELGFSELSKVYVFRGSKEIGKDQVLEQLGLGAAGGRRIDSYVGAF